MFHDHVRVEHDEAGEEHGTGDGQHGVEHLVDREQLNQAAEDEQQKRRGQESTHGAEVALALESVQRERDDD